MSNYHTLLADEEPKFYQEKGKFLNLSNLGIGFVGTSIVLSITGIVISIVLMGQCYGGEYIFLFLGSLYILAVTVLMIGSPHNLIEKPMIQNILIVSLLFFGIFIFCMVFINDQDSWCGHSWAMCSVSTRKVFSNMQNSKINQARLKNDCEKHSGSYDDLRGDVWFYIVDDDSQDSKGKFPKDVNSQSTVFLCFVFVLVGIFEFFMGLYFVYRRFFKKKNNQAELA